MFCNVSNRAYCGISSHKACCGLVPTSLVGLAFNSKTCRPNADRLERRPLVPIKKYVWYCWRVTSVWTNDHKVTLYPCSIPDPIC